MGGCRTLREGPSLPNSAKGTAAPLLQLTDTSRDPESRSASCSDLDFKAKVLTAIQSNFYYLKKYIYGSNKTVLQAILTLELPVGNICFKG